MGFDLSGRLWVLCAQYRERIQCSLAWGASVYQLAASPMMDAVSNQHCRAQQPGSDPRPVRTALGY